MAESFHTAHLSVQVEAGAGLTPSQDWQIFLYRTGIVESQPPLTSLLSHSKTQMFCLQWEQEQVQHQRRLSLGSTLPMMQSVQSCGGCPSLLWWSVMGHGARRLSNLASRLAVHGCVPKSMATIELYTRLNISLMRANSRAMWSRS